MTDEKPSELFESSRAGRQREQFVLQRGIEPKPGQIDMPAEESSDARIRHGRQLVNETENSITALLDAMENGQIDMGNDAMRDAVKNELRRLHDLLVSSTQSLKQIEAGDVEQTRNERADVISQFVQFSETLKGRVGAKSKELRYREEQYRSGQLTDAEYQQVILDRDEYQGATEREIREHAEGIDTSDPLFMETLRYLQKELAPLPSLEPGERLENLWGHLERQLLPFVKAYTEIVALFRQGRVKEEDVMEAWQEKKGAYERMCSRVFKLGGLTPIEAAELEERARSVVRPDEQPMLARAEPQGPVAATEQELPELELMKREEYDERIREMLKGVDDLIQVADAQERDGTLNDAARRDLLDQLREFPVKLGELDEQAENPSASRERHILIDMMRSFRERLMAGDFYVRPPAEESTVPFMKPVEVKPITGDEHGFIAEERKPTGAAVSAVEARRAYDDAKTAYAAVQHRLTPDQRREIRARLVGLNRTVRQAELNHAVAHAIEHAPSVAHAALASIPRPPKRFAVKTLPSVSVPVGSEKAARGIFGVLGDAFRLR